MTDWIMLAIVVVIPLAGVVNAVRHIRQPPANKVVFYLLTIIVDILFLAICFALKPGMFRSLNFETIGKGIELNSTIISVIFAVAALPFFLSFTKWGGIYPKDIASARELMGLPVTYLPDNRKEHLLFTVFIIISVLFEELLCRQLWFYTFSKTLHLGGDTLVVVTALLFGLFHLYQHWKGILSAFVAGLVLGKLFMTTGAIAYPIVAHLLFNLAIVVLSYRRIRDLKKVGVRT
jgi:membrane protease YdiL (CAAX protease family)